MLITMARNGCFQSAAPHAAWGSAWSSKIHERGKVDKVLIEEKPDKNVVTDAKLPMCGARIAYFRALILNTILSSS